MRAIVVEFSGGEDGLAGEMLESGAAAVLGAGSTFVARGHGELDLSGHVPPPDPEAGEPA
jgi:hypothetical protein